MDDPENEEVADQDEDEPDHKLNMGRAARGPGEARRAPGWPGVVSGAVAVATFVAVLSTELIGDKMLFTIAALSARYRSAAILGGLLPAQMAKMAVAVLAGGFVAGLPVAAVRVVSVLTFGLTAVALWRTHPVHDAVATPTGEAWPGGAWRGAALAFSAVFFTEWGDPGQLAAAAMAARYGAPWSVWGAATAALVTKGLLALMLGRQLRGRLPHTALRMSAAAICAVMAGLSAFGIR